jgi:hypothetical protein
MKTARATRTITGRYRHWAEEAAAVMGLGLGGCTVFRLFIKNAYTSFDKAKKA